MRTIVDGLDAVVRDFQFEARAAQPKAERVVVKHAGRAAERMRNRVAIDQGTTLESITEDDDATVETDGQVFAEAGPEHFVAWFLENGTARSAPQPFVSPSFEETVPEFERDMDDICGL